MEFFSFRGRIEKQTNQGEVEIDMAIVLVSLKGAPDVLIDKPVMVVGRSADCDIVLTSKKISRQHCCFAQVDERLVLRDLGSTNGVKINGRSLQEGVVVNGDEIVIGDLAFRVRMDPSSSGRGRSPRDQDLEASEVPIPIDDRNSNDESDDDGSGRGGRAHMVDTPVNLDGPRTPIKGLPPAPAGPPSDADIILSPWDS
jgi:pSer/pThr/pTyr-binding forkhead associated (FHA) protein